jgi:outer membrane lipoprotein-sorting protein
MRFFLKSSCLVSSCLLLLALRLPELRAEETPAAILEHTRSVYAALTSYSDTGTLLNEYGPTSHEEYSFATYFTRAPRHFMFDYRKPSDRIVIWGDPDAFHVWWKATGQVSEYPNPKNTGALTLNEYPTSGAITKIPPLLYSKAGLAGAIPNFEPERLAGMEDVAGNKCYRLEGTTSDAYAQTGKKVDARNVTVWIDSTSYLVRKILEDRPAVPGTLNRITTTFNPQANPKLNDDSFKFAPPK